MVRFSMILVVTVCLAGQADAQENNQPPKGFKAIFNGKDLTGWKGARTMDPYVWRAKSADEQLQISEADQADMLQHWSVENGEIVNDGHGVFLSTVEEYRDYEFFIDYKTVAKADSGIYLKGAPQIQIWDYTKEGGKWNIGADKGSGGLWNNSSGSAGKDPLVLADKPFGEWNRVRVVQVGERTSVWLNGKLVVDHARFENKHWNGRRKPEDWLPLVKRGPVQLQTHGGEIRWRNVFVRRIENDEVIKILATKNTDGFESVFNGKDFSGWSGPVEQYEIENEAIRCKKGQGGTIYTDEKYEDFVARFEFKLPVGGNNGLAIRYPGKGDAAYVGMCELQVLHNNAKKYSSLDKRQYHGSAYGMVASRRGYLREPGKWNFQQVTVKGSTIKVELNGTLILNTDLGKVKKFMGGRPHPGLKNVDGHFGFCGHSDPVEFRNVFIKTLK